MNPIRAGLSVGALLVFAGSASANGAMGLALSLFPYSVWLVYVAAMVLFEALWIGRATGVPFRRSLGVSLGANAITLVVGLFVSGIFGYMLYGALGTTLNPNPFGEAVLLLTVGGAVSALVEAPFWNSYAGKTPWRSSLAAHALGVPIALAILLIPSRPYPGLEGQARWRRQQLCLDSDVKRALQGELYETGRVPKVRSFAELLEHLRPRLKDYGKDRDLWAAAYAPHFERFDTGERKRGPQVEWNAVLAGKKLDDIEAPVWLIRFRYDNAPNAGGHVGEGFVVEGQSLSLSIDDAALGFVAPTPSMRPSR